MTNNTIETSETFWSFQGEGCQTGRPQVWIRTTMCNFQCKKFGNPFNEDTTDIQVIGFDPRKYKTLEDMPIITKGCDSSYSWHRPLFQHVWKTWTLDDLAERLLDLIPYHSFIHPLTHQSVGLTITGGEPTLKLRELTNLLLHPLLDDLRVVTIETNCSVPIRQEQINIINKWLSINPLRKFIWSNSPKLSNSGEPWEKAIKPTVALMQQKVNSKQMQQYFKFVSDGSDQSFAEIEKAMKEYYQVGISHNVEIWIMPEGATLEMQNNVDAEICNKAMARGYNVSPRVHVYVYGNAVGT